MYAKKHLGQHFLRSRAVLKDMLDAGDVGKKDTVLEIGPGKGILTQALLDAGANVIAVETDAELIGLLQDTFAEEIQSGQLQLVHGDIRTVPINRYSSNEYKIVANIPYYITGDILRHFLSTPAQPKSMTLLVQKEVAERIARSKKESILSFSVKAYGAPRYVKTVPARYFSPPPKVDSAILHIGNISKDFFNVVSEEKFFSVVKAGFASKRKKLISNLAKLAPKEKLSETFKELGLSENTRAEEAPLEVWKSLTAEISRRPAE